MSTRRIRRLALVAVMALVLSACGAMPTSGDVFAGEPADEAAAPNFEQLPDEPVTGSGPQQIVEDFVDAATSPSSNYRIAALFLRPEATWNPREAVQVYTGAPVYTVSPEDPTQATEATVTMTATVHASVDGDGIYDEFPDNSVPFTYDLTRDSVEDEWRIAEAPGGIVMAQAWFEQVYQAYPLYFFDPTMSFLVPDRRYFPSIVAAGRIASALVSGAHPQLSPAVVNSFPEGTTIREGSVAVDATVATISFEQIPQSDSATIGKMRAQLMASLKAAGAQSVDLTLGSTPLAGEAVHVTTPSVETRAVVIKDDRLGYLTTSAEFSPFTGFAQIATLKPTSVVYQPTRESAVVRAADGRVLRLTATGEGIVLDDRPGLVEPTVDPAGYVWTVPSGNPADLHVATPDDTALTLPAGGLTGMSSVQAMQMSRDGTRLAVIGANSSGPVLNVYTVSRSRTGEPQELAAVTEAAELAGAGIDLAWLDELTVGVLERSGGDQRLLSVTLGGGRSEQAVRAGAAFISGVNAVASVRLLTNEHVLYTRRASTWQQVSENVQVLGVLQTVTTG